MMKSLRHSDSKMAVLYIGPAVLLLALVFIFPLFYAVGLSLFELFRGEWNFVGVDNYVRMVNDRNVWNGLRISVIYSFVVVALHLVFGLAIALLLNVKFFGRTAARVLVLLPWMIAPAIVGVIWRWVWDSQFGIANALLYAGGFIQSYLPWLGDVRLALAAIITTSVWRGFPFIGIMLLAGLQAIPDEQYEAATVDGASSIQKFVHITLPNLRHVIMVATTLDIIWTFKGFDMIYTLTQGGPGNATEILPITIYLQSFIYLRFGYASAIAVLLFLFLFVFTVIYMNLAKPVEQ